MIRACYPHHYLQHIIGIVNLILKVCRYKVQTKYTKNDDDNGDVKAYRLNNGTFLTLLYYIYLLHVPTHVSSLLFLQSRRSFLKTPIRQRLLTRSLRSLTWKARCSGRVEGPCRLERGASKEGLVAYSVGKVLCVGSDVGKKYSPAGRR